MTAAELLKMAQTIKAPGGEEMVILPKRAFEELSRALDEAEEDADDVAIYDARKADTAGSMPMPADVTMAVLKGTRRLRAVRNWKKITQQRLADDVGITQGHLSDLETGRRTVTVEMAEVLAQAMSVPADWIVD